MCVSSKQVLVKVFPKHDRRCTRYKERNVRLYCGMPMPHCEKGVLFFAFYVQLHMHIEAAGTDAGREVPAVFAYGVQVCQGSLLSLLSLLQPESRLPPLPQCLLLHLHQQHFVQWPSLHANLLSNASSCHPPITASLVCPKRTVKANHRPGSILNAWRLVDATGLLELRDMLFCRV